MPHLLLLILSSLVIPVQLLSDLVRLVSSALEQFSILILVNFWFEKVSAGFWVIFRLNGSFSLLLLLILLKFGLCVQALEDLLFICRPALFGYGEGIVGKIEYSGVFVFSIYVQSAHDRRVDRILKLLLGERKVVE